MTLPLFPLNPRIIIGVLATAIVVCCAGCSKTKTERGNEGSAGGGGTHNSADASNTRAPSPEAASAGEGKPTSWEAKATSLNGAPGQTFTLACSPGGNEHPVWGSDIYTADSSICTAAVHAGLITFQQGGSVTIELRPGQPLYGCSDRNGVTSSPYRSYPQSLVFKAPNTEAVVREAEDQPPVLWNTSPAAMVTFEIGKTYKFKCPAGNKEAAVWGTDIYTVDSSMCNAALHAGKLTSSGGLVTIELRPGESTYKGSLRNGIKTNDYGAYPQSFVVK